MYSFDEDVGLRQRPPEERPERLGADGNPKYAYYIRNMLLYMCRSNPKG